MRKIISVIKREYIQIVRTKGFIIGTILGPVLMAAFIVVPILVQFVSVDKQEKIGVVDLSCEVFMELDKKLDQELKDGNRRYILQEFKIKEDLGQLLEELNKNVLAKELTAYIYIPENISEGGIAEYVSEHVSDFDKQGDLLCSCAYPVHDCHLLWPDYPERGDRGEKFPCGGDRAFLPQTLSVDGRENPWHCGCGIHTICDMGPFWDCCDQIQRECGFSVFPSGSELSDTDHPSLYIRLFYSILHPGIFPVWDHVCRDRFDGQQRKRSAATGYAGDHVFSRSDHAHDVCDQKSG